MVSISVVGIGIWGQNIVEEFNKIANVKYCCHSGNNSNASVIESKFPNTTITESYDEILSDDTVEAVIIATPINTHATLAERALKAGKHAFVEKPLAHNAHAARELVKVAEEQNQRLFTGYVFLYAPAMKKLYQLTQQDPPVHIQARWEKFGTFNDPIKEALVCHDVAIAHRLLNKNLERAHTNGRAGVRTTTDIFDSSFATSDGQTMTASYDRSSNSSRKSVVVVTESGMRYEFIDDRLIRLATENDDHEEITPDDNTEPLERECKAFIDWIEGGDRPPTAGKFGAKVNEVLAKL